MKLLNGRRLLILIRWYRDVNLLRANIDASCIRLQHHRSALLLLFSLCHDLPLYPENAARGANPSSLLIEIAALLRRRHH